MRRDQRPPRDREHDDPEEHVRPQPRTLIALALTITAWGIWSLATSESQESALLGDHRTTAAFAAKPANAAIDGAQVFTGKCAACHQATGLGLPGVFPPLSHSPWVLGPEKRLVQILLHGIQGKIEVLGATYNGMMPSWNALSDAEIAAVATYVRSAFGNGAGAIGVDLVATERAATASRSTSWTGGEELEKIR